ncbi:N-acetyltransferase GCN5 [Meira miltonrushii]|uniref:N-acetyltransferase GCN5 n=1 Tax=Meira miltonrushii TaxID=1280837 RepID=A0A316VBA8_9BASI|nr:N-acetyltransferase GCN5 [Meira miltonrushii]PWN34927.1 N-acetyltransferase GCN5 [Meira miltonrushii]
MSLIAQQEITVRSARPQDEKGVISLWHDCNLTTSYNDPSKDFQFALNKSNSDILVALQRDTICGTVMCGHDGHRGWLYYVASSPSLRGSGIGKMMVNAGEEWLRKCGIAKVQLMIRQSNEEVMNFYQHIGYEHTPRIIMAKWL